MAAAKTPHRAWNYSHNPLTRPLGCNGKYGPSGRVAHQRRDETPCRSCRKSFNHYRREGKRGNPGTGRQLQPCGTNAAAHRHRQKGEELDLACRVAEAAYTDGLRKSQKTIDTSIQVSVDSSVRSTK